MSQFDESKHRRNHGQFASGAAIGAGVGVTGGALLTGALFGRRLRGFGPIASNAVHAAEAAVVHEAPALAVRAPRPHQWNYLKHGVHTPIGRAARQGDPLLSHDAQVMSRQVMSTGRISPKKLAQAEAIRAKRAKLAGEIRQWRRQGASMSKFVDTEARDGRGRFSGGAGVQRRTQHTMPAYYRRVGRVPHGTDDPGRELPVGSFLRATLPFHKPKALAPEDRKALEQGVVGVITKEREATIARGLELRRGKTLIPEGTSKRTINRAYNHASMMAVHRYGLGHYDFAMDDDLKAELTPLVPFMRYAERRVRNTMLSEHKGGWKPYREEFGRTFKDKRVDADGNIRKRVKPLQQIIKAAEMGTLCKAAFAGPRTPSPKPAGSDPAKPRDLVQPAQLAGAYVGATALGAAAARPAAKLASSAASFAAPRIASEAIRSRVGSGVRGVFGVGASLLGDKLGDWAGRRLTGSSGKDDKYRTMSNTGIGASIAGGYAAQRVGMGFASRRFGAALAEGSRSHSVLGTGLSILGGAAGEVAGNYASRFFSSPAKRPRVIPQPR